jgi:hypothetical protein
LRGETVLEHGVHPPVNDIAHRADAASEVAVDHWQLIRNSASGPSMSQVSCQKEVSSPFPTETDVMC